MKNWKSAILGPKFSQEGGARGRIWPLFRIFTMSCAFLMGCNRVYSWKSNIKGSSQEKLKLGYFRTPVLRGREGEGENLTAFLESSQSHTFLMGCNRVYSWKSNTKGPSHEKLKICYFRTLVFRGRGGERGNLTAFDRFFRIFKGAFLMARNTVYSCKSNPKGSTMKNW